MLGLYPKWDVRIAFAKRPDGEYASMSAHIELAERGAE